MTPPEHIIDMKVSIGDQMMDEIKEEIKNTEDN